MGNLYRIFDIWKNSVGEDLAALTSHDEDTIAHLIHQFTPGRDYKAQSGDQSRDATGLLYDYERSYMLVLRELADNEADKQLATWYLDNLLFTLNKQRFNYINDFIYDDQNTIGSVDDLDTYYYASGTGNLYRRSSWESDATWLHMSMGPFYESHAHQDQCGIWLYKNGWLVHDQNASSRSGIIQGQQVHNLVSIYDDGAYDPDNSRYDDWEDLILPMYAKEDNGGATVIGMMNTENYMWAACDSTPTFVHWREEYVDPRIQSVRRQILMLEPNTIIVHDVVETGTETDPEHSNTELRKNWHVNTLYQPQLDSSLKKATVTTPIHGITNKKSNLTISLLYPDSNFVVTPWEGREYSSYEYTHGDRKGWEVSANDSNGKAEFLTLFSIDGHTQNFRVEQSSSEFSLTLDLDDGTQAQVTISRSFSEPIVSIQ